LEEIESELSSEVQSRLTARVADGSRHAQTLEGGASRSSTDVGHNDQFKNRDAREFNGIFLDLSDCARRTEPESPFWFKNGTDHTPIPLFADSVKQFSY
jgi:hypothetical protein